MNRREFLLFTVATALISACGRDLQHKRIGLALGGGGAKGLAHILMLEVFDELGIRPYRIAGTSIGAVMGCLYASGLSGADIRQVIDQLTVSNDENWLENLFSESEKVLEWLQFFEPSMGKGGLIESDALMDYLMGLIKVRNFRQLEIPLSIVATDFWSRKQVVFDSRDIATALKASIAVPGLFNPVPYKDTVLVDGGLVNPVPYDLLLDDCDVVVAIDVLGERTPDADNHPSYFETTFNTFQIMQAALMQEKMRHRPPDIYIKPDIRDIRVLDFYKVDQIYQQSAPARELLFKKLRKYRRTVKT